MRIVIGGGPRTGKTTYALDTILVPIETPTWHTDSLVGTHSWSEASAEVAAWMHRPGPWIIEGVATARALRKFMRACPDEPCDLVVWCRTLLELHTKAGQDAMRKGCETVFRSILPELERRGVKVEYR